MSTLAEIEDAIERLPTAEKRVLLKNLFSQAGKLDPVPGDEPDPFLAMIGAFAGASEPTGRKTEDILYGPQR